MLAFLCKKGILADRDQRPGSMLCPASAAKQNLEISGDAAYPALKYES